MYQLLLIDVSYAVLTVISFIMFIMGQSAVSVNVEE